MNPDTRVLEVGEVLGGLRSVLGLRPDHRADIVRAFAASDAELEELHSAMGRVIEVAAKSTEAR
jgi:hypothetical protein